MDTQRVLDELDLQAIDRAIGESELVAGSARELLTSLATGQTVLDGGAMLEKIAAQLMSTLAGSLHTLLLVLAPALITGVVSSLKSSFLKPMVATICEYAGFLLVGAVLIKDLIRHVELANQAVEGMAGTMQAIFPLLVTLLVAVGGTASAAMFQPAVAWAGGTMTALIRSVTLPFSLGVAVITMVGSLSDRLKLDRLAKLFTQVAHWTLGIGFTVFLGVTMAQGLGTAAVDGVSIRTAKYALDNFIPIVGGMFADTVDTLVGCSLLIKNAWGFWDWCCCWAGSCCP